MSLVYIYFALSALLNAVVSTVLGLFILFKDKRSNINRTFALFCFGVAAWSYAYIFWPLAKTAEGTLLSFRLLHFGACFVSVFYLHFVVNWLGLYKQKKHIIRFGYSLAVLFALTVFTPLFIKDMVPKFSMRYWAEPGILYHFYLMMFFGFFFYSSYIVLKEYRRETGVKKNQLRLILTGMTLSFFGGSTNYFLWYNINIPPYGNILAASFVVCTAYAIVKYNLMNIRIIAVEVFATAIVIITGIQIFLSGNVTDIILRSVFFLLILFFGILLVKGTIQEVRRREEMELLSEQLAEANEKLKELDKAKTDFLSIASHQLRSPLTVTKMGISALLDGTFGPIKEEKQKYALGKIFESNERLIGLVNDFLNISRIEMGKIQYDLKPGDLKKTIESVCEELKPKAESKKLKLVCEKSKESLPAINFDEEKIRQVLVNLVDNSIKYTDKGKIVCGIQKKGQEVKFHIKDTGRGMKPEEMRIIFEKFRMGRSSTLRERAESSGFGLFVAKTFIEAHKGKIWAESAGENKGSAFYFTLPVKV